MAHFLLVNQSPKTKLFAKIQNFSIFCNVKSSIDWPTYSMFHTKKNFALNLHLVVGRDFFTICGVVGYFLLFLVDVT